ncbi:hypothetical protein [Roseivivax isoporae]|uniref:Uncharacterized protein n=1 Tax=Roseivivax isoporae LMG 25204 TaxID=1449351 RepID=X7F0W8_9RHOB|nr:hypothetical protein [Roseivivax isoporae]ETX26507.1 hypothetical protein RISW2_23860 [Roseivivax isoporae LMG 25204]
MMSSEVIMPTPPHDKATASDALAMQLIVEGIAERLRSILRNEPGDAALYRYVGRLCHACMGDLCADGAAVRLTILGTDAEGPTLRAVANGWIEAVLTGRPA